MKFNVHSRNDTNGMIYIRRQHKDLVDLGRRVEVWLVGGEPPCWGGCVRAVSSAPLSKLLVLETGPLAESRAAVDLWSEVGRL
jgi:hypothetical protein